VEAINSVGEGGDMKAYGDAVSAGLSALNNKFVAKEAPR
jgi:hypothetical protein